ncbi:Ro ribonucleoprotein autoantigen [Culex quinquefasciatus]|uniref:Ro ribonucleoprotein autoantigen n=1 Tax=Culex quinquefasciatus TaxID=7176 RepID=B0WQN1_CULQU|nr:Ro ribonucleoprotein autoantigen [Culex quinquefasciatus]|eukprot:XP_001851015.1 Ro ribonucleoprotein autoantigen [Culex quinquefasciatus]
MVKLKDSEVILRYLYLGTDQPFYIRKPQPLNIEEGCRILGPIKTLAEATSTTTTTQSNAVNGADEDPLVRKLAEAVTLTEPPLEMVERVMKSGSLVRPDECLFALAFLARTFKTPEEKHKVYETIPKLIERSEDLFQFVHFYQKLATTGKGFGHGMKTALTKWYDKHSAVELAKMFASDRSCHKWSHKDLAVMLHMNLKDREKMEVINAAVGGKKKRSNGEKSDVASKKKKSDGVENGAEASEELKKEDEKTGESEEKVSEAVQVLKDIKTFKAVQTATQACQMIKQHQYTIQLVPAPLQRVSAVWESLFSRMAYRDIVQAALVLQDYKLLKDVDTPFSTAYGNVLNRVTSVSESKLHPIFIYQTMRLYEERQRYLNVVKEAVHTANNLALKNVTANPTVMKQFYNALNSSMLNYQRTGLRFFVTLDLRSKQSKKPVFGNRLMSCQAAFVLLTLPMLKRETHVNVMSFTEQPTKLNNVNLTREMAYFQGCDHIQAIANRKTKVDICEPIRHAQRAKAKVDVFLTIVDSLIRVNPKRDSPVQVLNTYNAETRNKAVYIIVSLSRHQQDLRHADMAATRRVLEIVGCTEETPKVIDAYVRGHFT